MEIPIPVKPVFILRQCSGAISCGFEWGLIRCMNQSSNRCELSPFVLTCAGLVSADYTSSQGDATWHITDGTKWATSPWPHLQMFFSGKMSFLLVLFTDQCWPHLFPRVCHLTDWDQNKNADISQMTFFKCNFFKEKFVSLIQILLSFVPYGITDNESPLVQAMAQCWAGDKALPALMMTHLYISKLVQYWFKYWLVACSATSHYLNQCWLIVEWTTGNKFQWNYNENIIFSFKNMPRWKCHLQNGSDFVSAQCADSFWAGDTIGWHRIVSSLTQVLACCLTALSHYTSQCWHISEVL